MSDFQLTPPEEEPARRTIQERFEAFHAANPDVYLALRRLAVQAQERGARHIGIGLLWEVMRWELLTGTLRRDGEFRLNNDLRSRYARLLAEEKALAELFEVRKLRAA